MYVVWSTLFYSLQIFRTVCKYIFNCMCHMFICNVTVTSYVKLILWQCQNVIFNVILQYIYMRRCVCVVSWSHLSSTIIWNKKVDSSISLSFFTLIQLSLQSSYTQVWIILWCEAICRTRLFCDTEFPFITNSSNTQRCLGVKWFVRRHCLSNLASLSWWDSCSLVVLP